MTFEEIRQEFGDYTAVDDNRQRLIYDLVCKTESIPGSMAEVGVYKGGTSFLIAKTDPYRQLYACDTFEGLPQPGKEDTHQKGKFNDVDFSKVTTKLSALPNVTVIKGLFPNDSVAFFEMYDRQFSFVHIDVDLFGSTLACLVFFYSRMSKGGIIVIDDYNMPSCPGVKKAVDYYLDGGLETLVDSGFNSCYFIKE